MKVAVVIITRNRAQHLNKCLISLTRQTVKSFQVLVIDNNSNDATKNVSKEFKDKLNIRYILEKKIGRPFARNRALMEGRGDIMAMIDDDCEAFPDWVEKIMRGHKTFPKAVALQGRSISIPANKAINVLAQFIHESCFKENIIMSKDKMYTFTDHYLSGPAPLMIIDTKNVSFKLNIIKKLNLNFNTSLVHAEDFEFSKQILSKRQKIIFIPQIIVYHWDRSSLIEFLKDRYVVGVEVLRTQSSWGSHLFPKRNKTWWIMRGLSFFIYLGRRGYLISSVVLVPLFILEKMVVLIGRAKEYLRLRKIYFSSNYIEIKS